MVLTQAIHQGRRLMPQQGWARMASALVVALSMTVTPFFAQSASALNNNCLYAPHSSTGTYVSDYGPGIIMAYTNRITVPSNSSCTDIRVAYTDYPDNIGASYMRIRFYPTSGGSWTTNIVTVYEGSSTYVTLATNVIDHTAYRIESTSAGGFTTSVSM